MLHPDKNRINFGHALKPIEGYDMDFSIGTTYSLDLEALIFLPVALFFGEDLKIEKTCSNELLTALTQVPDKVQLFCQRGKISSPFFYHKILAFWEERTEQVHLDQYYKSFHPKIWLIRYVPKNNKGRIKYRFICTSRNLTKCNDWDVATVMEGEVIKSSRVLANKPLQDFIKYLDLQAVRKIDQVIIDDIPFINFELNDQQEHYGFHPIGTGLSNPLLSADFKADNLVVVSPFLHTQTIDKLLRRAGKLTIMSSEYDLDKLSVETCKQVDQLYKFNPKLEDSGTAAAESADTVDLSDSNIEPEEEFNSNSTLHAKLYVSQNKKDIAWYIGSANCTNPAESNNVEFLTSIHGKVGKLTSPDELIQQLTVGEKNNGGIFIPYEKSDVVIDEEKEAKEADLRKLIYDLSSLQIEGKSTKNAAGLFDYLITIPGKITGKSNLNIFFQPLSGMKGIMREILCDTDVQSFHFDDYEESQLTPYFLFTIKDNEQIVKQLVLKILIQFSKERMGKILKSILGNQEKLMKYLSYLLSKDHVEPMFPLGGEDEPSGKKRIKTDSDAKIQFPIYEKLLIASSRDVPSLRQTIKIVGDLVGEVDELNQAIITDTFKNLIDSFKETLPDEN